MYRFTHRLPHEPFPAPSRNEDAYALRLEIQERMRRAHRLRQEQEAREREAARALHHDHCPECGARLQTQRVREGEVRRCPSCRGAFLDEALFRRLTHPETEGRGYLSELLRGFVLEWTTGSLPGTVGEDSGSGTRRRA